MIPTRSRHMYSHSLCKEGLQIHHSGLVVRIAWLLAGFHHLAIMIRFPLIAVEVLDLNFRYNSLGLLDKMLPPGVGHINNIAPLFEKKLANLHGMIQSNFDPVIAICSNVPLTIVKGLGRVDVGHQGVPFRPIVR